MMLKFQFRQPNAGIGQVLFVQENLFANPLRL